MRIAPSVLSANFWNLGRDISEAQAGGADILHFDVMDGAFVPNISFGPKILRSIRENTEMELDVHLMITHPLDYIEAFSKAGADRISFHVETTDPVDKTISAIIACGKKPSLVIKPATPVEAVFPYLDRLSMVLVMTVEPGFGGQKFMPDMLSKVRVLKERAPWLLLEVDGGISSATIGACKDAGVDICVAGTGVFANGDIRTAIKRLNP